MRRGVATPTLLGLAEALATPSARDWKSGDASPETLERNARPLNEQAQHWPTPTAMVGNDGEDPDGWMRRRRRLQEQGINGNGCGTPLTIASQMWPTPTNHDGSSAGRSESAEAADRHTKPHDLNNAAKAWPTPTQAEAGLASGTYAGGNATLTGAARSHQAPETPTDGGPGSKPEGRRRLNPSFVEALMDVPLGWTDCEPSETRSCEDRPPSPSESCGSGSMSEASL